MSKKAIKVVALFSNISREEGRGPGTRGFNSPPSLGDLGIYLFFCPFTSKVSLGERGWGMLINWLDF